jgi:hypothetical protein
MSEQTGAPPVPVRSLNVLEASVDELSAVLIGRLVTSSLREFGCSGFSCGTFSSRRAAAAETEQ